MQNKKGNMEGNVMFKNPGEKLQILANIFFVLNLISLLILAFVFGWDRHRFYSDFRPVVFFTLIIVGPIISYVECLAMYAFGELVDNSAANRANTAKYMEATKYMEAKSDNSSSFYNTSGN